MGINENYIENPKTVGSGILCCIPQIDPVCPNGCPDCFYSSGRSFLEPLSENIPNIPPVELTDGFVVRVNDGLDSNVDRQRVIDTTNCFENRFFNTAIPRLDFPGPVVLTVNPGKMTDTGCYIIHQIPPNLMFIRIRTNTWNLDVVDQAVTYYATYDIPIILTFIAYFREPIREGFEYDYIERKRTMNTYWAIRRTAWEGIMERYEDNPLVYSCGTEGETGTTACKRCGNCLREFYATRYRMRKN